MNVKSFITNVLISEIGDIRAAGHDYICFGLVAQGIEFLGACLDNHDFFASGHSRSRFCLAINQLFPKAYSQYANSAGAPHDLYENLRCGLLHVLVPGRDIELIRSFEVPSFGKHLTINSIRNHYRLVLVSEEFHGDFLAACQDVVQRIDNKAIQAPKVYGALIGITP